MFFIQCAAEKAGKDITSKKALKDPAVIKGLKTEYTVSNGGRLTFGGWNRKGRVRFAEVTDLIEKARKTPQSKAAEQWALDYLRIKYKTAEKESRKPQKKAADEEEGEWDDLEIDQGEWEELSGDEDE